MTLSIYGSSCVFAVYKSLSDFKSFHFLNIITNQIIKKYLKKLSLNAVGKKYIRKYFFLAKAYF